MSRYLLFWGMTPMSLTGMRKISLLMGFGFIAIVSSVVIFFNHEKTHRRPEASFIKLGKSNEQYKSVDEYFDKRNASVGDEPWIKFKFLNNPYNLDDKNIVSIFINGNLVYRGAYRSLVGLKGNPNDLFSKDKRMMISMEILTDKTKSIIWMHGFGSKTVFSWEEDYKIIYCIFTPTNESAERVFFIPQREPMI